MPTPSGAWSPCQRRRFIAPRLSMSSTPPSLTTARLCTAASGPWRPWKRSTRSFSQPKSSVKSRSATRPPCLYSTDEQAPPFLRLLGLRPHARAGRRHSSSRRHRSHLPHVAGRGNVLPHDAQSRVRCVGDVPLLIYRIAQFAESAVHSDPHLPVALLSAFV